MSVSTSSGGQSNSSSAGSRAVGSSIGKVEGVASVSGMLGFGQPGGAYVEHAGSEAENVGRRSAKRRIGTAGLRLEKALTVGGHRPKLVEKRLATVGVSESDLASSIDVVATFHPTPTSQAS